MPTPPPRAPAGTAPVQLRLATGIDAGDDEHAAGAALAHTKDLLLCVHSALDSLYAFADRRVELDDDSVERLRRALTTLDAFAPLPGRLGYLTRLLNGGPVADYPAVVADLAFAVHLNDRTLP